MKKVLAILFIFVFLVGCSSKNYIEKVDVKDSSLQYNYEIHNDFKTLIITVYEVKNEKWSYVEKKTYDTKDIKNKLGIAFDDNKEISFYIGNEQTANIYTYQTHMESFDQGTVASRDRLNIKNKKELPFLAYWSYYKDTKYEVTTHSETLGDDFLDHKVKSDGGFLITLTFQ